MIGIAWRMLRRQSGTLAGALIMTVVGAALLTAFIIVQDSVSQARAPVERFAEAEVVAAGDAGVFPPVTVREVEGVPGVAEVVSELTFPVQVLTEDGIPVVDQVETASFGHAWSSARLTPFEIVEGTEPGSRGEVVLDASLAQAAAAGVGDAVRVEVGGTVHELRVSGIAAASVGNFDHQHAVFLTPDEATEVADRGHGRVDSMGVLLEPGADPAEVGPAVEQRIGEALAGDVTSPSGVPSFQVAWGADRGELEGTMPDHRASAQAMTMLVWIVAFMAVAVIGAALITSVRRRAGQFSLLRAVGATPRQVRTLCQAEALLISVVAVVVGGLLGLLLAWGLVETFQGLDVVSPVLTVRYGWAPVAISGATVLVVGQVAAWLTARTALRFRPGDALAGRVEAPARRRRTWLRNICGAFILGSAGVLQVAGMSGMLPTTLSGSYGMIASGLVIMAIALLGSSLIHLVASLFRGPVATLSPTGGYLAAANVRFHHRRYAGVAAPLAVGVAIAGWALSGLPLFALSNAQAVAERFDSDFVVRTPVIREAHTGLSEQARTAVANVDGVEATVGVRETWLHTAPEEDREVESSAITRATVISGHASQLLDLGAVKGDLGRLDTGDGIALGSSYADRNGIALADQVEVRLTGATAPTSLEVVALFDRERGGQEAAVVSQAALGDNVGRQWFDYVLVAGSGNDLSPEALEDVLSGGGVVVEDHREFLDSYVEERRGAIDNLGTIATALVGVFLVVASVNALALSAADRSSELSAMRRLNATPGQIRSMVGWETALTVIPAWLLGVGATLWMALAMAGGDFGAALWAFPTPVLLLIGLLGLLLALGGSLATTNTVQRAAELRERRT
ncbi:FtsX-like permease family protein [Nocardiopsis dassonvillei]|uniref:FtsX-like permease family protein n=1 Tax=Nocardiopsis dassonvillei TaxID=2014 RepID=UPI003627E887